MEFLRRNQDCETISLIAIYARVSTSRQEDEQTIQTQLLTLREFAEKNNYKIVQEYIDDGWSGDSLMRPSLDRLRQEAKDKIWDGVLMYDPDRLARRYSYQELVSDELREAGVEVMYITVSSPKNSEDKILHGVRGLFAEYERAKITERFRLGKLRKVKDGHVLVSEAAYGYTYIPKQDGRHGYYEINAEEARVVKMIFGWVADEGVTLRKVLTKLHAMGIKPRESKRGVWATSTLSTLLRNKVYIGEAHWGSSYAVVPENPRNKERYRKTKKSSRRMRPEEEWHTIPVPAIIEKEVFDRARARLQINFSLCRRNNKKNEYLLAGKIKCACGRSRTGEGIHDGKHLYYRCTDRVSTFPLPRNCKERGIDARVADKLVWEEVAELMRSPELLSKQVERWVEEGKSKAEVLVTDTSMIEKEIEKLKVQEDRYNKAYGAGLFTVEELKEYVTPLRGRIMELLSEKQRVSEGSRQIEGGGLSRRIKVEEFTARAAGALANLSFGAKRAIVLNTIEKVVGTKDELHVYGYIPVTSYVELFPDDRHGVNTSRHGVSDYSAKKLVPFSFVLKLPPPRYERIIVSRNEQGRIVRSKAARV